MNKNTITSIFIFFVFSLSSQEMLNEKLDVELLRKHYYKYINEHRDSLKLPRLTNHSILNLAALDQAQYCNQNNTLTHYQELAIKKDVLKRVKFHKGHFNIVGENCLITFINIPVYKAYYDKNVIISNCKELAESMFLQWKNSPGHYKNMIRPEFLNSGFNIVVKNDKVYGVEVFSGKEYIPPFAFSTLVEQDFGIEETYDLNCIERNKLDKNIINGFSNYTMQFSDTLMQYYENIENIKSALKSNKDGLAIDIVLKKQFSCKEDNRLNPRFYDGYLLPPTYKESLLKGNTLDNNEFMSPVGIVPQVFVNKPNEEVQFNTLYLSNGKPCLYSYPVAIESDFLPLVNVQPIFVTDSNIINKEYKAQIDLVKKFDIPFEVNSHKLDSIVLKRFLSFLEILDPYVETIDIHVFSSIEGNRSLNEQLYRKRSIELFTTISKKLKCKPKMKVKSEENWNLFYEQMARIEMEDSFKSMSRLDLRRFINENKSDLKSILDEQRIAKLVFKMKPAELLSNTVSHRILLLDNFIEKKNIAISKEIYNQLMLAYKNEKLGSEYLSFINTPDVKFDTFISTNYLASLILRFNKEAKLNVTEDEILFLRDVLSLKSDYAPFIYNQIALKISLYYFGYLDSLIDFENIENDLKKLKSNQSYTKNDIEQLEYNYYLCGSKFYFEKRKFTLMYAAYNKFKSKLKLQNLNDDETIDIVLYMNGFHDLYTSLNLLENRINISSTNEYLKFLYISTGARYNFNNKYKTDYYLAQLDELIRLNSRYLCPWLRNNFQILRIDEIKNRICKKCTLD